MNLVDSPIRRQLYTKRSPVLAYFSRVIIVHALSFEQLVIRIKGEYIEMPGLWLTPHQGARLWSLGHTECVALLGALVDQGFLTIRGDGKYGRAAGDHTSERLQTGRTSLDRRTGASPPLKADLP